MERLGHPEFPWRKLARLIGELPADSRLSIAAGGPDRWWTPERHMQAATVDLLRVLSWQMGSGKTADRPEPIPRPGVGDDHQVEGNTAGRTPEQVRALLARMGHGKG